MLSNLNFHLRLLLSVPLLPILYWQGKKAKAAVPDLPPAQNPSGLVPHPHVTETIHVLSFGESAFAGIGIEDHQSTITGILANLLAEKLQQNIEWEVIAKSGYNAEQVREELVPLSSITSPDLILIGLGANDAFEIHFPEKWQKDMTDLIKRIRLKYGSCPIVIAHLPPVNQFPVLSPLLQWFMGGFIQAYHQKNQTIASQHPAVHYVNQTIDFDAWADRLPPGLSKSDLFCDGVHPGELAHQLWGQELVSFVLDQQLLVIK